MKPIAILFFLLTGTFFSFAHQPVFTNYKVKDGLPSSQVYQVFQDSEGYMWFATDAGVSRYNGYTFKNFTTENGLPDNTILGIVEDKKHRLWFRSVSGKLSYYFNDSIHKLPVNDLLVKNIQHSISVSLYVDENEKVYMGIYNFPYYFIISPPYDSSHLQMIPVKGIYVFLLDSGGSFFGTAPNKKISSYLSVYDTRHTLLYNTNLGYFKGQASIHLMRTADGFFYSFMNTILEVKNGKIIKKVVLPSTVLSLNADREGNLLAGTFANGVRIFHKNNLDAIPDSYLTEQSVTSAWEDTEGGYWFSTLSEGIFYMPSRYFIKLDKHDGLINNCVTTMSVLNKENILAGFNTKGLNLIGTKRTKKLDSEFRMLLIDKLHKQMVFSDGKIYTTDFLLKNKKTIKYKSENVYGTALAAGKDGFWIGSVNALYKVTGNKIEKVMNSNRITAIAENEEGLFLGTREGLALYKNNKLQHLYKTEPLLRGQVSEIKPGNSNTVFIATKGNGVIVKETGKVYKIEEKDGLASNVCKTLYVASDSVLWVGTNKGLNKIYFRKVEEGQYFIETYNTNSGLSSDEINKIVINNNMVWLGTSEGITYFNPVNIKPNLIAPPVYISSVSQADKELPVKHRYVFSYKENYITISYVGLCYKAGGNILYKYKMTGLDTSWHFTNSTTAQYPTLQPGSYSFIVYARNNNNTWSTKPATVYLTITPPFWSGVWFKALILIIVSMGIFSIFTIRVERIKERSKQQRRIAELELKALRAQMNPHFIFNSINSIQYFILQNDADSAYDYLVKFSRLIRNVLENSKQETVSLARELETLSLYIALEKLRFEEDFDFILQVDETINTEDIFIPTMIIQPFVENAIWHGLMPNQEKNKLYLKIHNSGNSLEIIIEDNGVGRTVVADRKNHTSLGMMITRERMEAFGKAENRQIDFTIDDLRTEYGKQSGTRVKISILQ